MSTTLHAPSRSSTDTDNACGLAAFRCIVTSIMKVRALLIFVSLICSGSAMAQAQTPHVCGAGPGSGEVMAGVQPGGNGMAPTPLCYWASQSGGQQQGPSMPTGYWEKTWGAVATSESGGALGTAVGLSDKAQAEQVAMQDCKAKGGGGCMIGLSYHISAP